MPRRTPGAQSLAEPGAAGRRLSAALGSGSGLLDVPHVDGGAEGRRTAGRGDTPRPRQAPRWRTGLRAAVLLGAAAAVLSGWFWWRAATGAPEVVPLSEASSAAAHAPGPSRDTGVAPPSGGAAASPASRRILVHVAGAVVKPGVVELPEGSRLLEAIAAAGGCAATADPDRLNLAAVVEDGAKVLVPERGQPVAAEPAAGDAAGTAETGAGGAGTGGARINLNTAGVEELGTLPRVGPVLAQRIVAWRQEHGRFQNVEELDAVDGVGPKLLAALLPLVRV
jgi:competence protein ComEA